MIYTIAQKLKTTDHKARASVTSGETALGAKQVTLSLATEDAYGMPTMLGHLKLSMAEARDLAARLVHAADEADQALIAGR